MHKIDKFTQRLSPKERFFVETLKKKIFEGSLEDLDVKKLRGTDDIFRVRKGRIRVIYYHKNRKIIILSISHRDDNTYKNL